MEECKIMDAISEIYHYYAREHTDRLTVSPVDGLSIQVLRQLH